ncbi:hypothetical protein K435DRAFT_708630 [Dendrothele bispora CBS 962.96]|uniref:Zn(2)-C6 fungal-type domain-containing protein n=1 Tax=Dendrothele bispora (strain CBS 962.96) TaxID=1314807 RepID=A0A4V4HJ00_DENBC|nr:hypothetical protein K435DRAFT_708630 [Dendrothele bispora CBS 962.96]
MTDSSHSSHRRMSRKHASEDDIDLRRARGEISCAECRRLKLRCDRKNPCSSCVRRGCPSICPNGSLSTGQGSRFVLADTSQLHTKITEMGQRIRQLEDALAIFHSSVSNEPHPLLREELLAIKFGPEKGHPQVNGARDATIDSIDALGTLTIGDRGESKYFGRSAGSEIMFLAGADLGSLEVDEPVDCDYQDIARLFPLSSELASEKILETLLTYLPEQPRAWALCETYLEQAAWMFQPLRREEIIDELLTPIYRAVKARDTTDSNTSESETVSPHKLSALYIIFALGALVDLTLEPFNIEAEKYFQLCRAALSLRYIFDSPELSTVQTVVLMAYYHSMAGRRYTLDSAWCLMSVGAKLAQSVGLHRDSARWNLSPKFVQRRRFLFYEIFCAEIFHSLALGRPPSIRLSYADCEFPSDTETTLDQDGKPLTSFYQWKYEFCTEILAPVLELTLTAKPPKYEVILDLDRKVREKIVPPHLNIFMNAEDCSPATYMRGSMLGQYRTVTLLFLHRSFFAQAMLDYPVNPLRSPYAPSFLAAYRCASGIIKSCLNHFERFPELCARWWGIWTHLFTAAIIVGTIVTRSPSSTMTPNAFIELGLACDLFQKGAANSRRARSGLSILNKLRNKAFEVYSQYRSGNLPPPSTLSVGRDYGDDELALFGGQTRVLFVKLLRRQKRSFSRSRPSSAEVQSPASSSDGSESKDTPSSPSESLPDVHPSLVEYLSLLPPHQHPQSSAPTMNVDQPPPNFFTSNVYYEPQAPPQTPPPQQDATNLPPMMGQTPDLNDPSLSMYGGFHMQNPELPAFTAESGSIPESSTGSEPLLDLGMMMSGDSGIDEQWKSFMRESGLLDNSMGYTTMNF